MKNKINDSISFLLAEYKRLKLKEQNKTISKEEKEAEPIKELEEFAKIPLMKQCIISNLISLYCSKSGKSILIKSSFRRKRKIKS